MVLIVRTGPFHFSLPQQPLTFDQKPPQTSPQLVRLPTTTLRSQAGGTRTILYWNKFYNNADFYVGFGDRPFRGCPVATCRTTDDRSQLADADAVLFHMLNPLGELPPQRPGQRYVFFLKEPPTLSYMKMSQWRGVFNLTMTYRRDSDVLNNYNRLATGPEPTPLPALEARSRAIAWIVSHCDTISGRELYVDLLQEHMPVDIYGSCGDHKCPTSAHGSERHVCHRQIAEHYHFYLAFENGQCRDYITEKVFLPLKYGMVPIVLGTSRAEYEQVAPPGSFIHIDDFTGPEALAAHLRYLMVNRTAYASYHAWRQWYHVTGSTAWCDLCAYLHQRHGDQYYEDIGQWWLTESQCKSEPVVPEPEDGV